MMNMKIGALAAAAQCQVETIRFYERESLLPPPVRSSGNYRLYNARHLERLAFIRHCRSMEMSLPEVRRLLHFRDAPEESCTEVNQLLDAHIARIGQRMAQLQAMQGAMLALRTQCSQDLAAKYCGILNGLAVTPASVECPA
ncbi:Cd(II)/Pb(II)-responsive transcriptional regulator [Massilia sp. PAMC28688]|uniref:Cd(II)/Pb(II)-responsive transcriptional regulator n=1 Tax=Massilia sp. PAMC28688 TaxID=2861283 RepID=UPI001C635469|nr:Cd(II)/Pb(II)-responsive transcriptional regulator [Massilia sp. PAMC28688]QYF93758.1 Cd(II)/Pb(II)-responsive transcriptional regulator [Massilia sp. PAMC28688]